MERQAMSKSHSMYVWYVGMQNMLKDFFYAYNNGNSDHNSIF